MNYLIRNASVVNEGEIFVADVLLRDGFISRIFRGGAAGVAGATVIDAGGKYLIPGIIDEHVHFREPGMTAKADIYTESRAAVAGGVTSFMDMPNTVPQTTTVQLLEEKFELASQKSLANYSFYLGATNGNLREILSVDPRKVCGIKLFMGSSTGNMLVDDGDALKNLFREAPCLIAAHCEDEAIIRRNTELFRRTASPGGFGSACASTAVPGGFGVPGPELHPRIRTAEACVKATRRAVELASRTGARLHILHISTAMELDLLRCDIPLKDKKITAETCPHYLLLDESRYTDLGSLIKCNPAIKSAQDRTALLAAVRNGLIDTIGTDHAPHLLSEKLTGNYFTDKSGFPSVQHSFQLVHKALCASAAGAGAAAGAGVTDIVKLMCHNPAILYGIDRRGFIREGYHADLALVDLNHPCRIAAGAGAGAGTGTGAECAECAQYGERLQSEKCTEYGEYSKCGWCPYEGFEVSSLITHTFVNGNLVFENGTFHEDFRGEQLEFSGRKP